MNREEISKALPDVEDTPPRPDFMYKSKLAYRDLSKGRDVPTIIRMRNGK